MAVLGAERTNSLVVDGRWTVDAVHGRDADAGRRLFSPARRPAPACRWLRWTAPGTTGLAGSLTVPDAPYPSVGSLRRPVNGGCRTKRPRDVAAPVTDAGYRFACEGCGACFRTNAELRSAMLEEGCLLCGAAVTAAAFTPT